jgi:hypothetical protein
MSFPVRDPFNLAAALRAEIHASRRASGRGGKPVAFVARETDDDTKAFIARCAARRARLVQDGATFSLGVVGGATAVLTAAKVMGGF